MRATQKITYSIFVAIILFLLSFALNIVPCTKAPNIPSSEHVWSFCNLNPDTTTQQGIIREYFGYTTSITTAYALLAFLAFVAALTIFHFTTRSKKA